MIEIKEEHMKIVGHSLGINVYHAKTSKKKKDKQLPEKYYRNRFCADESHDDHVKLTALESGGLMRPGVKINQGQDTLWYVTDEGILQFEEWFKTHMEA